MNAEEWVQEVYPIPLQAELQSAVLETDPLAVQKPPLLSQTSNSVPKRFVLPVKIIIKITKTTNATIAVMTIQNVFP